MCTDIAEYTARTLLQPVAATIAIQSIIMPCISNAYSSIRCHFSYSHFIVIAVYCIITALWDSEQLPLVLEMFHCIHALYHCVYSMVCLFHVCLRWRRNRLGDLAEWIQRRFTCKRAPISVLDHSLDSIIPRDPKPFSNAICRAVL